MLEQVVVYEHAGRVAERPAAHRRSDHADRQVGRALERRTSAQVDDVLAALDHPLLQVVPVAFGHLAADQLRQGASGNERRRSEDRHLLAVAAVGTAVTDLVGRNPEIFGQFAPQARGVQRREGRKLRRADTRIDERHQPRNVDRVEDHHDVFHIGAVSLDVLAELCGDLGIALEQVFARHAGLAGRAARRNDIGRSRERLLDIARPGDVHPFERTVVKLLGHALERRSIGIVKADVGRKAHHQRRLRHVRADHAGRAHDRELVVCQKFHNRNILHWYNPVPGSCLQKKNG